MSQSVSQLFERTTSLPDPDAAERLAQLVGLDEKIVRMKNMLSVLIHPAGLSRWLAAHHPSAARLAECIHRRPPLIILSGDVGSGKTELAETIGDAVARQEDIDITVLPLSLASRGQGRVGEMTQLVSAAFEHALAEATKCKAQSGNARGAVILLIDEADALAQSRETDQMHHEDRAGVNAFIRGIDRLANAKVPAAVIMCTNRLAAMDPAVKRRAAEIFVFERPDDVGRLAVLSRCLDGVGLSAKALSKVVELTGPQGEREYGFTYSDLVQRLVPAIVLDAYPSGPIREARALDIARSIAPTPPFRELQS
ncbi:AAA family ATPase [Burkholderia sp. Bp9142]|uniref:AAA family ATPase n=1 Tax=Burkholderia sp. Bp9142 TaxID=2184573 RepID=UPI000F5AA7D1|nr:AAA family ATPase [Burkholderia sp. Bp9142]RQR34806.1 AAA family ATPase [Burkholderia sp. Bp9142]